MRHLGGALHEKLIAVELQPVGIVDRLAGLNADHHVLRVRVVLAQVVAVIGGHQRKAKVLFQLQQVRLDALLFRQPLVLDLEIEVSFAEDVVVTGGSFARGIILPFCQPLGNLTLQARGKSDQALRMLGEKFLADARLVIEAVQRRLGNNLDQVAIALIVLGQHDEVVVAVSLGRGAMVFLFADVQFAAQNRLYSRIFGGIGEGYRAKNIAMIGHGDRRHVEFLDPVDEALNVASAVEHRIIRVQMEMYEFRLRHRCVSILCVSSS